MTLKEQGWRFVLRGASFRWMPPSEIEQQDIDCTEMADGLLQRLVDLVSEVT